MGRSPYSLAFNGRLAGEVADLELGRWRGEREREKRSSEEEGVSDGLASAGEEQQQKRKTKRPLRVLMGHSLGAVCASAEAARDPGAVDALVLVAPAIVANGRGGRKREEEEEPETTAAPTTKENKPKGPTPLATLPLRLLSASSLLLRSLASLLLGWSTRLVIVLSWPFLVFLLRAAVRSFQFWENGLSAALGGGGGGGRSPSSDEDDDSDPMTPAGIPLWLSQRYRLPSLVRGWETGFLLFLLARVPVAAGGPSVALARAAGDAKRELFGERRETSSPSPDPSLTSGPPSARLAAAVRGGRVPLLIIHGDRDALVPLRNSRRLVEQLSVSSNSSSNSPLCELVVLKGMGHTPQEEAPREFVEAVASFLERVERGKSEEEA